MSGKKKPLVVITRKLPDPVETRMRELFDARLNIDDRALSQPELVAAVREAAKDRHRWRNPSCRLTDGWFAEW